MSNKRARADTAGAYHPLPATGSVARAPGSELEAAIDELDPAVLRKVLLSAAQAHEPTAAKIRQLQEERMARERTKVVDFDVDSKIVWKEINVAHRAKSGSQQYEAAFGVFRLVRRAVGRIAADVRPYSAPATKTSAIETLRKIAKTVCLSHGVVGSEVRKNFQCDDTLEGAVAAVRACMAAEEVRALETAEWKAKVRELVGLAKGYDIFDGLEDAFDGRRHVDGGGEHANDEDEDDEDDDEDGSDTADD